MKKIFWFLMFLIIITQYLFCQVPQQITYQGRLKEYGELVTGKRDIKIAIFDDKETGSEKYSEIFKDVEIDKGFFILKFFPKGIDWREQEKWIEVVIAGRILSPRKKLTIQPYAVHAGSAEEITKLDGEIYFSIGKSTYMKVNTQGLQVNGTIEAENITIKGNPVESISNLASVAMSGDYNDLENTPNVVYTSTIPAGEFLEQEVGNIKNAKLANGEEPWTVSLSEQETEERYLRKSTSTVQDAGYYIGTDEIRARDNKGLKIYESSGTSGLYIGQGGIVGLGTTHPTAKFEVKDGSVTISGNNANLCIDGNVGIGTISPSEKLDVFTSNGKAFKFSNKSSHLLGIFDSSGSPYSYVNFTTEGIRRGFLRWNPSYFAIEGDNGVDINIRAHSGNIKFDTSQVDPSMVIKNNGYIGIGTADPSQKLHVNGNILAGDISAGHVRGSKFEIDYGRDVENLLGFDLYYDYDSKNCKGYYVYFGGGQTDDSVDNPIGFHSEAHGWRTNGYRGFSSSSRYDNPGGYHFYGYDDYFDKETFYVTAGYTSHLFINGQAFKPGGGSWAASSDIRLKQNVEPLYGSLEKLLSLKGVTYEWKEPEKQGNLEGQQIGMIAQEVEKVFPEWVGEDKDGYKTLAFRGFEALTVEALRELKQENNKFKEENNKIRQEIELLKNKL